MARKKSKKSVKPIIVLLLLAILAVSVWLGIEKFKNTYKIIYKCSKCNQLHKNIMATDDNMDLIIELSKNNELDIIYTY